MEYRVPAALEQITRIMAIPAKKTETRLVRHLTVEEMQAILDAPAPTTRDGIRDRAMLYLCFAGGLRVSELIGLQVADLTLQPHPSALIHGKGRRQRSLPLWKETTSALRSWLAVRGAAAAPELFLNARGERMTRSGFEYILRKHVRAAATSCPSLSMKRASPHVLRPDGSTGHQGPAKSLSLARTCKHANNRDIHSSRSLGKTRSTGICYPSKAQIRTFQGS